MGIFWAAFLLSTSLSGSSECHSSLDFQMTVSRRFSIQFQAKWGNKIKVRWLARLGSCALLESLSGAQFWRLDVWNQDINKVGSFQGLWGRICSFSYCMTTASNPLQSFAYQCIASIFPSVFTLCSSCVSNKYYKHTHTLSYGIHIQMEAQTSSSILDRVWVIMFFALKHIVHLWENTPSTMDSSYSGGLKAKAEKRGRCFPSLHYPNSSFL
jgi:hypothetical protein